MHDTELDRDDEVAVVNVAGEEFGHRLHGRNERAQMYGNVLALQDHFRLGVEQGRRIVMGQIEHR
jgi:hypothetical protein